MARALLEWSQEELALRSALSISTVRKMEEGCVPRAATARAIRGVIEDAGLELVDNEGVRRKYDVVQYRGPDGCDKFYMDVIRTLERKGGELLGFIDTQDMVWRSFDAARKDTMFRLERLGRVGAARCLLSKCSDEGLSVDGFRFRVVRGEGDPSFYFVYGDKYVVVLPREDGSLHFVVFEMRSLAQAYRRHFETLWARAEGLEASRFGEVQ